MPKHSCLRESGPNREAPLGAFLGRVGYEDVAPTLQAPRMVFYMPRKSQTKSGCKEAARQLAGNLGT